MSKPSESLNNLFSTDKDKVTFSISYNNLLMVSTMRTHQNGNYYCNLDFFRDRAMVSPQSIDLNAAKELLRLYNEKIIQLVDQKSDRSFRLYDLVIYLLNPRKPLKQLIGNLDQWQLITLYDNRDDFVKTIYLMDGTNFNIIASGFQAGKIGLTFHLSNNYLINNLRYVKYLIFTRYLKKLFFYIDVVITIYGIFTVLLSSSFVIFTSFSGMSLMQLIIVLLSLFLGLIGLRYYLKRSFKKLIVDYLKA